MESPRSGEPARDTGLPPGVRVGSLGRRLAAYVIDSIVPAVAGGLVSGVVPLASRSAVMGAAVAGIVVLAVWGLLCWSMLARRAATPGMRLMKLQLVGFSDGRPVGWGRAALRWVVYTLLNATGVGWVLLLVFLLMHPRHQGWHDLAADGVVIAERPLAPAVVPEAGVETAPALAPAPVGASYDPRPVAAPAPVAAAQPAPLAQEAPTALQAPVVEPEPIAPSRSILEGWVVELDDGREIPVDGLVLLGRNPHPAPGEEDAQLIKLADETRTVSKTHLALGVDDAGMFVVDRASTNGSTVTTPDRVSTRCPSHAAVSVAEGSIVSIGDHWMRIRRDPA